MLCHVVEPNKIMVTIVAFCPCRECKVEGGLETGVMAHISPDGQIVLQVDLHAPSC